MPLTVPTHPALVVPLKLRWPGRFDGVALVVGSMAPDFPYVLEGSGLDVHSHAWHALLWYAIPVTAVVARLVRWAAPAVAAHLPAGGPFALRDFGVLGSVRPAFAITAVSAVVGVASHIVWDSVTHPFIIAVHPFFGGILVGLPWWHGIRQVSDIMGTVGVLAMLVVIGRRHLLVAWHGPPPATRARPWPFWPAAAGVAAALLAVASWLPGNDVGQHVVGTRVLGSIALALLAAAAAVRLAGGRAEAAQDPRDHEVEGSNPRRS